MDIYKEGERASLHSVGVPQGGDLCVIIEKEIIRVAIYREWGES